MTELQRLAQIADQVHQEEVDLTVPVIPFHARNGYHVDRGSYVCNDNGQGCHKLFPDIASKHRHQAEHCQSWHESDRCLSSNRMLGG